MSTPWTPRLYSADINSMNHSLTLNVFCILDSATTKKGVMTQYHNQKRSQRQDSFRTTTVACCVILLLQAPSLLVPSWQVHCSRDLLLQPVHTPRAHWRQLPIQGGDLFNVHNLRVTKATHYDVVDELALCTQAISLHQAWDPGCPHQGHTGDKCPFKVEAYSMCATCESRKQRNEVVER